MRVLVTGAAGFVGYAVAALLVERGHEVMGLTRSGTSAPPMGGARLTGDLRTPETLPTAVAEVEGLCHLAGLTKVRESRTNPVDYWRTNVGGTLATLHRFASARAGRMVLAATGAIGAISLRAVNVAAALPGHPDPDTTRLIPQLLAVQQGRAPELVVNGDGTGSATSCTWPTWLWLLPSSLPCTHHPEPTQDRPSGLLVARKRWVKLRLLRACRGCPA